MAVYGCCCYYYYWSNISMITTSVSLWYFRLSFIFSYLFLKTSFVFPPLRSVFMHFVNGGDDVLSSSLNTSKNRKKTTMSLQTIWWTVSIHYLMDKRRLSNWIRTEYRIIIIIIIELRWFYNIFSRCVSVETNFFSVLNSVTICEWVVLMTIKRKLRWNCVISSKILLQFWLFYRCRFMSSNNWRLLCVAINFFYIYKFLFFFSIIIFFWNSDRGLISPSMSSGTAILPSAYENSQSVFRNHKMTTEISDFQDVSTVHNNMYFFFFFIFRSVSNLSIS